MRLRILLILGLGVSCLALLLLLLWREQGQGDRGLSSSAADVVAEEQEPASAEVLDAATSMAPAGRVFVESPGAETLPIPSVRLQKVRVVSELGTPIAAAQVEINLASLGKRLQGETDARGEWGGEIPVAPDAGPEPIRAVVTARALGFTDGLWVVDIAVKEANEELVLTLALAGTLTISVIDGSGSPAADAVVFANYLGSQARPSADRSSWPAGVQSHYRIETDAWGQAIIRSLREGWWELKPVGWRDWEGGELKVIRIGPQQQASERLEVTKWDHETYSSGWLELPLGMSPSEVYLRKQDAPHVTHGVYEDGAFFLRMSEVGPVTWEVVASDGRVGATFDAYRGQHGVRVGVQFAE